MPNNRINSEVRGPGLFGPMARVEYRALESGQHLILERERDNRADENAVIVMTALRQPCGYVAKEHAKIIAPEMDSGIAWRAKVLSRGHAMRCPQILLMKDYRTEVNVVNHSRSVEQRFRDYTADGRWRRTRA